MVGIISAGVVYPGYYNHGYYGDENRDRVPDVLDHNRDGKVDYGYYGHGYHGYGYGYPSWPFYHRFW